MLVVRVCQGLAKGQTLIFRERKKFKKNIHMKKLQKVLLVVMIITISISVNIYSQPPPPPSSGHGSSTNQAPGEGAPIGGGLFILLGLGAAYGGKKLYDLRKEKL